MKIVRRHDAAVSGSTPGHDEPSVPREATGGHRRLLQAYDARAHSHSAMKSWEGVQDGTGLRFGIVVSKYNELVTRRLLAGAVEVLTGTGVAKDTIEIVRVPGAFEIPLAARRLARTGRFGAVICLGAVIRGETPHFEYISAEASRGIARAAWEADIPVIFGVLTTESVDQALERSGSPERNRGAEAARTAIEMATLFRNLHEAARQGGPSKKVGKLAGVKVPKQRPRRRRSKGPR